MPENRDSRTAATRSKPVVATRPPLSLLGRAPLSTSKSLGHGDDDALKVSHFPGRPGTDISRFLGRFYPLSECYVKRSEFTSNN